MAPAAVETAATETGAMETTPAETAIVKFVTDMIVEIVIAKSMMEMATKETAEADDAKIRPAIVPIVPIRIVSGVWVVIRYGCDTVWRGRLRSTGRLPSNRGVKSMRRGRG